MNDAARIRSGLNIWRMKKNSNKLQDKRIKSCLSRFDSAASRTVGSSFYLAVSHSMGAHAEAFRQTDDSINSNV